MIYILGGAFDPPHAGHSAIVRSILHYKNPEKIIIIPSGKRDDKNYRASDEHRIAMLDIFVSDIADSRVIIDNYFLTKWEGNMITRDVDIYTRNQYGDDICHIFGTDTIESMTDWDSEQYAAKNIQKLFVPRK
jgi:nicotinate-nucleotide adenylyltransferase